MRSKYRLICFSALILAAAAARADDPEAQKRGQASLAAPASPSDAPRADLEAQKPRHSLMLAPVSSSVAPSTDLEDAKKRSQPQPLLTSRADAPAADPEAIKRAGNNKSVTATAVSRSLEEKTQRASQAAIQAIPMQRATDSHGSSIPPIRALMPLGRL
jgi:hypothetical protein